MKRLAILFSVVGLCVVAFQLAIAAGAPWGYLTMGGAFAGRLPPPMRVAAVAQAMLILFFVAIVGARAGLMFTRWRSPSRKLIWMVVAFMVVGAVLNAITTSAAERALWLPVTLVLAICAVTIARAP